MAKNKKKSQVKKPRSREVAPLAKKTQQDILESTRVHQTTGQKRPHEPEKATPQKKPKTKHALAPLPFPAQKFPIDHKSLSQIFFHKSARILEARIAASIPYAPAKSFSDLFDYLFLNSSYSYDSICFCGQEDEDAVAICLRHGHDQGVHYDWDCSGHYLSRREVYYAIFKYILKRISCLPIIEAEGYVVNDDTKTGMESATDAAFIYFLKTLLEHAGFSSPTDSTASILPHPNQPATITSTEPVPNTLKTAPISHQAEKSNHGTAAIMTNARAIRAYGIFTAHPMKFKVQMKVGQNLKVEERVVVWCTDVGETGGWDVQWEYWNKNELGIGVAGDRNYAF